MLHDWINYKQSFFYMYGMHIYEYYKNDTESLFTLKHEILYM